MTNQQTIAQHEIAQFIVETLHLDIDPESIPPETSLVGGEHLGLDSIDVLEIAFALTKKYGITIRSGDDQNIEIFASLAKLSDYIHEHKKI